MATTNKVRVEKILVAKGNVGLPAGGTALINTTTGAVALADGQLAVVDLSGNGSNAKYTSLSAGDTVVDSPVIALYQGTADSANPSLITSIPLPNRPFEKSQDIEGRKVTFYRGKAYEAPMVSASLIGGPGSQAVTPLDLTVFALTIAYHGRRTDIINGRNEPASFPEFTTPDYTSLGLNTTDSRDHLLSNLAAQINRESRLYPNNPGGNQSIALAINSTAAGTSPSAITISGLNSAGGDTLVLYSGAFGSVTLLTTAALAISLKAMLAVNGGPLANTAVIETSVLSVAGTGTSNIDRLIIAALDDATAFYDRISAVKTRLNIGLRLGFDPTLVFNQQLSEPFEGIGLARQYQLLYDETDGLRKFDSVQPPSGGVIAYPSPIVANAIYDVYVLQYYSTDATTGGESSDSPFVLYILVPDGDTATKASLEAVLNPYLFSVGLNPVTL